MSQFSPEEHAQIQKLLAENERIKKEMHSRGLSDGVIRRVNKIFEPDLTRNLTTDDNRYQTGGEFMSRMAANLDTLLSEYGIHLYLNAPIEVGDNFSSIFYETIRGGKYTNIRCQTLSTDEIEPDTKTVKFGEYGILAFTGPEENASITRMDTLRNLSKALKELKSFEKSIDYQIWSIKTTSGFIGEYEIAQTASITDPLTGLANRRGAEEDQGRILEDYKEGRNNDGLVAIMIDLDKFKAVNDTGNHALGDQVLREFSNSVRKYLFKEYGDRYKIARLGGEEFQIIITGVNSENEMKKIVDGLMDIIRNQKYYISDKMHQKITDAGRIYKALHRKLRAVISEALRQVVSQKGLTEEERDRMNDEFTEAIIKDAREKGFVEPIRSEVIDRSPDGSKFIEGGKHFIRSTASVGAVLVDGKTMKKYVDKGKNPFPGIIKTADTQSYISKQSGRDKATFLIAKSIRLASSGRKRTRDKKSQ